MRSGRGRGEVVVDRRCRSEEEMERVYMASMIIFHAE